jgi:hypothetical protein
MKEKMHIRKDSILIISGFDVRKIKADKNYHIEYLISAFNQLNHAIFVIIVKDL